MIAADLNQEFYLGELPEGMQFKITKVTAFSHYNQQLGGYQTSFNGSGPWSYVMVHNNETEECVKWANPFPTESDPENPKGKSCVVRPNIAADVTPGGLKIGGVKFRYTGFNGRSNHPQFVKVDFEIILKENNTVLAKGFIKFTPSRWGVLGRPDKLPVEVGWDYGAPGTSKPSGHAKVDNADIGGIGIDPAPVYLIFKLTEDGESLYVTFTRNQTLLNKIARVGVNGLLTANEYMFKYASGLEGIGLLGSLIKLAFKVKKGVKTVNSAVDAARNYESKHSSRSLASNSRVYRGYRS
ncbi:hypothetical protein AA313_de0201921 [Arthrobotrys entomopaga]|nr:hypothetical protein AA313_de0201921 [Arthrobotrys entomopaga]